MRSTTRSRMRPSHRAGRPVRLTRSRVCQRRPSTSQGCLVSPLVSALGASAAAALRTSARALRAAAFGSNRGRSARGPAARTPARIAPVRLPAPPRPARGARGHDLPPGGARLGAEVDHPVGRLDHLQVVLDDDDRVAQVGQAVDDVEELADVVQVQPGGRLVEDVEGPAGVGPRQLGGELDALGLAAGERRRGLPERDVAEADVVQGLQDAADLRHGGEELEGGVDGHGEHVGDRPAAELHRERLGGVARPVARLARDPDVGQEVHLDPLLPRPLARLAPAPGLVEAEPPRRVAAHLRLGQLGEQLADQVERPRVGAGGRGRRAPERGLVDADDLVDLVQPLDRLVRPGRDLRPVQLAGGGLPQDVLDERALARAADARHHGDDAEGDRDVDVLEVVVPGAPDDQRRAVGRAAVGRDGDRGLAAEVAAGQGFLARLDLRRGPGRRDLSAAVARTGAEIDEMVGRLDHLAVVLDQDERVAQVAQVPQRREQPGVVARVQADRRLVEHVEHARQPAADLARQTDALALAAGEGRRTSGQAQVVEARRRPGT